MRQQSTRIPKVRELLTRTPLLSSPELSRMLGIAGNVQKTLDEMERRRMVEAVGRLPRRWRLTEAT